MRCYQPLTRASRFDYTFLDQRDRSTDVPEEDGSLRSLPPWSENYGNVRASANPPSPPLLPQSSFVAAKERRRRSSRPRMSIEFPDNFSPFVSRCVRLGGRASPWQGATRRRRRRRRDTLVACAHPCDATCYETRNVTALADYLANEGFFRLLAASLSLFLVRFEPGARFVTFPFARVRRMQWPFREELKCSKGEKVGLGKDDGRRRIVSELRMKELWETSRDDDDNSLIFV